MYDCVIRGGLIADGTGRRGYVGDVALQDGLIAAVGAVAADGREEIDAEGLVVAPGFIGDAGGHLATLQAAPERLPRQLPGTTTLLAGAWAADQPGLDQPDTAFLTTMPALPLHVGWLVDLPALPAPTDAGAAEVGAASARATGAIVQRLCAAVERGALGCAVTDPTGGTAALDWLAPLVAAARPSVVQVRVGEPAADTVQRLAAFARAAGAAVVWQPSRPAPPPSWPPLLDALAAACADGTSLYWYMVDWPAADHPDTLVELLQSPHTLLGGFPREPRDADGSFVRGRLTPCRRWPGRVPLELLIHKLTALPAAVYGLGRRGRVAAGYAADLVAFNADTAELAYTLVAGTPIFAEGQLTSGRAGTWLHATPSAGE